MFSREDNFAKIPQMPISSRVYRYLITGLPIFCQHDHSGMTISLELFVQIMKLSDRKSSLRMAVKLSMKQCLLTSRKSKAVLIVMPVIEC